MRLLRSLTPSADTAVTVSPTPTPTPPWPPLTVPEAPAPFAPWVDPDGKICPTSHPVKAKLSSGIFHLPGGVNYERTNPERCYVDAAAAEADGLRASKR